MGDDRVQALEPRRPIVIAHRGASGYLPEHTREAKALAYGQGADYLEQDVVATRDGELVVLHDVYLEQVTDVARRYPDRRRADGHFYVLDFDLAELRELTLDERSRPAGDGALYPTRFPRDAGIGFRVSTLAEEIRLIEGLNRASGRKVGLYPEIKAPAWHAEHGIDLTALVIAKLAEFGYTSPDAPVFVQCFDAAALERARMELGCRLPMVLLVDGTDPLLRTPAKLMGAAAHVQGLGPPFAALAEVDSRDGTPRPTELARSAKDAGLLLHPFTFRRESLPPYAATLEELLEIFLGPIGVDGVFCDFPDVAKAVRDRLQA